MQAAGRLRKLGRGQTLRTIATEDIGEKIRATAVAAAVAAARGGSSAAVSAARAAAAARPLTSRDVLQWAMANTVAATLHGVLEWAHQGLLFAASHGAPEHWLQPEQLGLEELYGSASTPAPLSVVVAEQHRQRQRPDLAADMESLMADLAQRSAAYGAGHSVMAHGGEGEECERECEREEEEEEEVERQVARVQAAAERDWEYSLALGAASLEVRRVCVGWLQLGVGKHAAWLGLWACCALLQRGGHAAGCVRRCLLAITVFVLLVVANKCAAPAAHCLARRTSCSAPACSCCRWRRWLSGCTLPSPLLPCPGAPAPFAPPTLPRL